MSDERVKPTAEMRCTSDCPSFNDGLCMVTGDMTGSEVNPLPGLGGIATRCVPAVDAIQDAYQASRKNTQRQEYMTIIGHEDTFDDKVNASLADGWQLHGPTSSTWDECRFLYSQAMVRDVPAVPRQEDMPEGSFILDRRPTDPQ